MPSPSILLFMRALSIRQPYAEEILRGIKTIEYRTRSTRLIGKRFYIYAPKLPAVGDLKRFAKLGCEPGDLPVGVVVGTAKIARCTQASGLQPDSVPRYEWHLIEVKRLKRPRKPTGRPQPVWFTPF